MKRILKFELDQTDVETILAALRERRYQLRQELAFLKASALECADAVDLLNEICVTEEKIHYQKTWGVD